MSILALVPPDPAPRQAAPPPMMAPSPPVDWPLRQARVRVFARTGFIAGALVMVGGVAALPYTAEWTFLPILLCGVFVLPGCGLALLLAAVAWRTRDDLQGLLMAVAMMVGGIAIAHPVSRFTATAWASSHLAELEPTAAERAATLPGLQKEQLSEAYRLFAESSAGHRLDALGLGKPYLADGGVVFEMRRVLSDDKLFYADPSLDGVRPACPRATFTPLGGRWYLYDCPGGGSARFHDS